MDSAPLRPTQDGLDIRLTLDHALVDEPSGIVITGCDPRAEVVVTALVDAVGGCYRAEARFEADETGQVDTATAASRGGTYSDVDPYGLGWSGEPIGPSSLPPWAPVTYRLQVETATGSAEATLQRPLLAPGASVTPVDEPGVSGLFARPAGDGPFPAVVAFAGSSGGLGPAAVWAPVLASHGFAVLAIAYFGGAGLPSSLERIEVEVVERAVAWLRRRDDVAAGGVAVMGLSRGSELALFAGALLDDVAAVVAVAPSGVSWAALGPRGPLDAPAWTFRGHDLPYAPLAAPPGGVGGDNGRPVALRPIFEAALADADAIRAAEIPVERVKGPVLFVSGGSDAMWPSTEMADISVRRAARHDFGHAVVHLRYPEAGHTCFGVPGTPVVTESGAHPLTGGSYAFGGTRAANAAARADCWPRVVGFLADALVGRTTMSVRGR
jgi:dienelactone hydrolase